jgi:hypothetical protein
MSLLLCALQTEEALLRAPLSRLLGGVKAAFAQLFGPRQQQQEDTSAAGPLPTTAAGVVAAVLEAAQQVQQVLAACSSARQGREAAERDAAQHQLQAEDMQRRCQRFQSRLHHVCQLLNSTKVRTGQVMA